MKIYYQNCNGFRSDKKRIEWKNNCEQEPYYDVICLTETNLNESYKSEDYFGKEYKVYRKDRSKRVPKQSGGGVLIAVRTPPPNRKEIFKVILRTDFNSEFVKYIQNLAKDLTEIEREELKYEMIEHIWIEVTLSPSCSLLIGNHYVHSDVPIGTIKTYCKFLAGKIESSAFKILCLGDFNLPEFNWEKGTSTNTNSTIKNKSLSFYELFCKLNIKQRVSHGIDNYPVKNILDLVVTNFELNIARGHEMVKLEGIHPCLVLSVPLPKVSARSDTIINQNKQFVKINPFEYIACGRERKHNLTQQCVEPNLLECTACGREWKNKKALRAHEKNVICKEILASTQPEKQECVEPNPLECTACGRECKTIQGLRAHERNVICKEILASTQPEKQECVEPNPLECTACGRMCKTIQGLRSHERGGKCFCDYVVHLPDLIELHTKLKQEFVEQNPLSCQSPIPPITGQQQEQQQQKQVQETSSQPQSVNNNNSLACAACGRECKTIQGLRAHERNVTCKEILQSPTPPIRRPQQEQQSVPATTSKQQTVPVTTSKQQTVPATTSKQQTVPVTTPKQQTVPATTSQQQNVPATTSQQQNVPATTSKQQLVSETRPQLQNVDDNSSLECRTCGRECKHNFCLHFSSSKERSEYGRTSSSREG